MAVAPGCTSSKPTAITGTVRGYWGDYNNWSVNVLVGIDLLDASNNKVEVNGINDGYSYVDKVNPDLAPPGSSSVLDQTVGKNGSTAVLCVPSKVKTAWFELYPKDEHGATDKTYFGGANDQKMTVKANTTNRYTLRLPTAFTSGGNTGDVNGYANDNGHAISPSNLQVRVFPVNVGSTCGVQGFSAAADYKSSSSTSTYYKSLNIAAGQCGAASQKYKVIATCKSQCGTSSKSITKYINVVEGKRPRVDFSF